MRKLLKRMTKAEVVQLISEQGVALAQQQQQIEALIMEVEALKALHEPPKYFNSK